MNNVPPMNKHIKQNPIIRNEKEILLDKKERNSSFPKFYYPQSNKKKSWWSKKESPESQLTSQSSNDSVESL